MTPNEKAPEAKVKFEIKDASCFRKHRRVTVGSMARESMRIVRIYKKSLEKIDINTVSRTKGSGSETLTKSLLKRVISEPKGRTALKKAKKASRKSSCTLPFGNDWEKHPIIAERKR